MLLLVNYYCCSYCLFYFSIWSLFCCIVLSVISSFAIISLWKRERERDGCLKIAFNGMGLLVLCVTLPRGAMGWSAVCDCGISWPYSTDFFHVILNS